MINELLAASHVPTTGAILYVNGVTPAVTLTAILPFAPPLHVAWVTEVVNAGSTAAATVKVFVLIQFSAVSVIVIV